MVIGYLGIVRDITTRKEVAQALRKREEQYRLLVKNQTDLVVKVDREGLFEFVSPSYCQLFGKSEEELLGNSFVPLIHEDDRQPTMQAMEDLYRPPHRALIEQRAMTRHGWRWLEWVDTSVLDQEGNVVSIIGVGRDVTDRKRVEEELERERRRLMSLMESLPAWVALIDEDCRIRYCNHNFQERFGFKGQGTCYSVLYGLEGQCPGCNIRVRLQHPKSHEARMSDGRVYEVSSLPFVDVDGCPRLLELGIDITEKKALETEAVRNHQLALLGQLAAGVAHEVNNPINGIINYAQLLEDRCRELGENSDIPGRIMKEGDRIANIVKSLLSFARNEPASREPVSLPDVIQVSLNLIQGQLNKEGIEIALDVQDDLPLVEANGQQIEQVVLNLLSNARQALGQRFPQTDPGKKIEIACRRVGEGHMVEISITDFGVGIPRDILDNIYDPFFSTKAAAEGTGLGLSISYGIIKDHHGLLSIQSREGEYTRASFRLPAVAGSSGGGV
jgi:PAS domain S-box-containing protein